MRKEKTTPATWNGINRASRRTFLAGSTTTLMGLPRHVLGGKKYVAPSDTIYAAIIGVGNQGIFNMKALAQEEDVRIVAMADPAEEQRYHFRSDLAGGRKPALLALEELHAKKQGKKPKRCKEYGDFRRMLEKEKGIDAVLIATPDHAHAYVTVACLKQGKHVYCEKPLCHTIGEVRKIVAAAREAGVATQMGNQGHSGEGIRLTCEWIWDGAIGPIREVHSWAANSSRIRFAGRPSETPPIPKGLDWDLWLGPAAYRPYHPAYTPGSWRSWHDFGSGVFGDFACHHLDPAFWALKLGYPASTEPSSFGGGQESYPQAARITFNFPGREGLPPLKVCWYDGGLMPPTPEELELGRKLSRDGHGILFVGEKGKMVCGGWGGTPRLIPEKAMQEYQRPARSLPRAPNHHRDWLNACKGGTPACANFEAVAQMVEIVLMGALALRSGEKLYWDGPARRCTNVASVNELVDPPCRKGWEL
jgi:predicted dehydrogenase